MTVTRVVWSSLQWTLVVTSVGAQQLSHVVSSQHTLTDAQHDDDDDEQLWQRHLCTVKVRPECYVHVLTPLWFSEIAQESAESLTFIKILQDLHLPTNCRNFSVSCSSSVSSCVSSGQSACIDRRRRRRHVQPQADARRRILPVQRDASLAPLAAASCMARCTDVTTHAADDNSELATNICL